MNIKKQRGFLHISTSDLIFIVAAIAVMGWVVIEGGVWLFSHLSIGWVP